MASLAAVRPSLAIKSGNVPLSIATHYPALCYFSLSLPSFLPFPAELF